MRDSNVSGTSQLESFEERVPLRESDLMMPFVLQPFISVIESVGITHVLTRARGATLSAYPSKRVPNPLEHGAPGHKGARPPFDWEPG